MAPARGCGSAPVLRLLAGGGVPLVGLAARDDGEAVTAVEGIELFGQLGVAVPL